MDFVSLNHGIGQQLIAEGLHLFPGGFRIGGLKLQSDVLADAHLLHLGMAQLMQAGLHRCSGRIKDRGAQVNLDLGLELHRIIELA